MKKYLSVLMAAVVGVILLTVQGCNGGDDNETKLAAPQGVKLAGRTAASLSFQWDAVAGAKGYTYRLEDASGNMITLNKTSGTSANISGLKQDATYYFMVKATAGSAEFDSDYSSKVAGVPSDEDVPGGEPLDTPANVAETGTATANSISFKWDAVEDATGYEYKLINSSDAVVATSTTTSTSAMVSGLAGSTTYRFAVRALGSSASLNSEYSAYVSATTASGGTDLTAIALPTWENDGLTRAFPGAEGGGMFVTGGRGGAVYRVTNLNDSGTGSLRDAVNKEGARTIVFDVDGIIELNSPLEIKKGDLTIAGQTAPGDGICLKNHALVVKADNVIIRYIRSRMGDEGGSEDDAMWGRWQQNIIIDHCSMSWSMDECSSFYANRNFTMQWCLIAESIRNGNHAKGTHGYGAIWGGVNASYHHNLLAHHESRNPRFDGADVYKPADNSTPFHTDDRAVDFRNCVVYNFSNFPAYGGEDQKINFVGNYYKWGPASSGGPGQSVDSKGNWSTQNAKKRQWFYYVGTTKEGTEYGFPSVYIGANTNHLESDGTTANINVNNDNWVGMPNSESSLGDYTKLTAQVTIAPDGTAAKVTTHTASGAFGKVVEYSGASHKRDAVDTRIAGETTNGTATYKEGSNRSINGYIDSQKDVGGWPTYATATPDTDTDGDGIPDWWEDQFGLDKNNKADGNNKTLDVTGRYTNLEMYLWWIVREDTLSQYEGGDYVTLN